MDLLNTYMKNSEQEMFRPFGGSLHLVYHEPKSPPGKVHGPGRVSRAAYVLEGLVFYGFNY